jgi:hypothetical protein
MTRRYSFLILIAIFITACNSSSESTYSKTTIATDIATIPTETFPSITSSPSVNSPPNIQTQCVDLNIKTGVELPSMKGLTLFDQRAGKVYIISGKNNIPTYNPIPSVGRILGPEVSPDHRYLLFDDSGSSGIKTTIINNEAKIVWEQSIHKFDLYGWFDAQRLWRFLPQEVDSSKRFLLLNQFTGQTQLLTESFPDIKKHSAAHPGPNWSGPPVVYNPELSQVVYGGWDEAATEKAGTSEAYWPIFLYDIPSEKILATLPTRDLYGKKPMWLSDGSKFIIAADISSDTQTGYEVFSVSSDGSIQQLTHLWEDYAWVQIADQYSISPDGNYLAIWIKTDLAELPVGLLAILDVNNGELTNYCLPGFTENGYPILANMNAPIWSPDGSRLAVMAQDQNNPNLGVVTIINFENNTATQLSGLEGDVRPVGWMEMP